MELYRKISDLLTRPEKIRLIGIFFMVLFMGLLEAVGVASMLPFLLVLTDPSQIEDRATLSALYAFGGFEDRDTFLIALGFGVFALLLLSLTFKMLTLYVMSHFVNWRRYHLSRRMLESYYRQPYAWFLDRHSSDLAKNVLSEVDQVMQTSLLPSMLVIAHSVVVLSLVTLIVIIDPVVALTAGAVIGGLYALIYLVVRKMLTRLGAMRVQAVSERFRAAQEGLGGIKDVKVLSLEDAYLARFAAPSRTLARCATLAALVGELPRHLLEAVLFGGMLALVLVLLLRSDGTLAGILPVVGLYAFAGLRMFPAMQQVYRWLTELRYGRKSLELVHADLMETRKGLVAVPDPLPPGLPLTRELCLEDVHFAYPSAARPALQGLTMRIPAKTTIGIVGGTGAGKTTAVDILLGLLSPTAGRLTVDGLAVEGERVFAWRQRVGYVPQSIYLIDDTVAGNIAFGVPRDEIDMAAVERVARIAELHDFVSTELPKGYETHVGERGVRLSGGQRQRIGIARALYRDPDVLILDEATSALDNITERAVMGAVNNLAHAKTVVMIAHRLTTVRGCDRIFLLEKGRVIDEGSYDELLETSETFRAMALGVN
ncbi:MAG: ABC transporter ATP-binding protein [Paracoccaceae bacterium]